MRRGAYVISDVWQRMPEGDRQQLRARAVAGTRASDVVMSHWSAAALHGLPLIGTWPTEVHILSRSRSGRSRNGVVEHVAPISELDITTIDGLRLTSLPRTLVDMAAVLPLAAGVAMADSALFVGRGEARCTAGEVLEALARRGPMRAHRRVARMIELARTCAESPLESASRVVIIECGFPLPDLQREFCDGAGLIGRPDFAWPQHRLVGEADGELKYLDERYRGGRSVEQVVLDEKYREDRLRALGFRVVRWGWRDVMKPEQLCAKLEAAGLPRVAR
ncbi:hypothetical protein [Ruicaihuangia caeni]|uniref:DUF559 domain-containing protein n=1 Tax=Ruicaihuangia caeni TaxID=3042517 RepID=A0AAW6TAB7_9MICO|nr:hypothetical protein [Klugiella sp. YN-L-19]MDI2098532.1 hypothetical protein [Klugiella sp. YN-L-19]